MDKLLAGLANHGARITMADPRVTSVQNWIFAGIGGTLLLLGGWVGNSINELNKNMTKVIEQNIYAQRINDTQDRVNDAQDLRLTGYDERLRSVERKVK